MADQDDSIRIVRVDPHGAETEHFRSQMHDLVHPFTHEMKKERRSFPLQDDAIVLVAKDASQPDADGKPKGVGSVAIIRLVPGEYQSSGLLDGVKYGEIKRMVVLPGHQGTGVAAKLLKAAEDAGKSEFGFECILVETLHTLKPAQRFYEKSGYQKREVWGVYYKEDSVGYGKWV